MSQMCILDELKTKCSFKEVFADSEKDAEGNDIMRHDLLTEITDLTIR